MPIEVTQLGIASGIDINYSHVPRAVKRLEADGLLYEVMAHVKDQPTGRRRKAYFLADSGIKAAEKLLASLNDHAIIFKDKSGKTSEINLSEINNLIKSKETLFTLYKFLTLENAFDLHDWETTKDEKGKEVIRRKTEPSIPATTARVSEVKHEIILEPEQYQITPNLIGREVEFQVLKNAVQSPGPRLILFTGVHGIGKSTLVANVITDRFFPTLAPSGEPKDGIEIQEVPASNIYWCNVSGFKSLPKLMLVLYSIFLKTDLDKSIIESEDQEQIIGLFNEVINNLAERKSVIILDGLEFIDTDLDLSMADAFNTKADLESAEFQLNYQFDKFILGIIDTLGKIRNSKPSLEIKIIITTIKSIHPEKFPDLRFKEQSGLFTNLELTGLHINHIKQLLGTDFTDEDAKAILHHTDGNPQIVKTITEIDKTKLEELKTLPPTERALLVNVLAQEILEKRRENQGKEEK